MTREIFESFAQNGEDVVLWRALCNLPSGRFVEIGGNDPRDDSITWAFYQRGWRGLVAEPVHSFAEAHRALRPGDVQVEAFIGEPDGPDGAEVTFHEVPGTGLSTVDADVALRHRESGHEVVERRLPVRPLREVLAETGFDRGDVHFMVVDVEGAEASVLRSVDLTTFRPWVMVIESTAPTTARDVRGEWERRVLDAGYTECLFDGLSRFYVADEHRAELGPALSYPAGILDHYTTLRFRETEQLRAAAAAEAARLEADVAALTADVLRWRQAAVSRWSEAASSTTQQYGDDLWHARHELALMRATLSWRITRPIRGVRTVLNTLRVGR